MPSIRAFRALCKIAADPVKVSGKLNPPDKNPANNDKGFKETPAGLDRAQQPAIPNVKPKSSPNASEKLLDKANNQLPKSAGEFPNMKPGPWSKLTAGQQADVVNGPKKKTPVRKPVTSPAKTSGARALPKTDKELDKELDRLEKDPTLTEGDKAAESEALVDRYNQLNFR